MKFAYSILIFHLFWFDSAATDDENACMKRKYQTYDKYTMRFKFGGEYPVIYGGLKRLFGKPEFPSKDEKDNLKQLCWCAFAKSLPNKDPDFKIELKDMQNDLQNVKAEDIPMKFPVSYYISMVKHFFPAHICKLGTKKLMIAKGYTKKSTEKQIYNIYIGTLTPNVKPEVKHTYELKGIIDNVDVEMPVFGAKKKILNGEDPET